MSAQIRILLRLFTISIFIQSCTTVDVFEKNITIPDHEWSSNFKPEIQFDITDTVSLYNIYTVIRHTDAYRYKNIWVNIYTQAPADSIKKQKLDLKLATDDKGWLGSGMDDIFEHRIQITDQPVSLKAGTYKFRLENIMREDPLEHVMNVGIRVERTVGSR
jgi:gliding motility-associated lipoprotein GldH